MLPGRLGIRFALEALFLLALAVGAGLADLRPALIVLVMAVAWVLVALIEFTAERIARAPLSYLLPAAPAEEEEPQRIFWPRPEERTVVAPPSQAPVPETTAETEEPVGEEAQAEEAKAEEPQPEELQPEEPQPEELHPEEPQPEEPQPEEAVEAVEAEGAAEPQALDEPEAPAEAGPPPRRRRVRSFLRRREEEIEPAPHTPPRHVKLLPRRAAAEPSRAAREVAELFGASDDEESGRRERSR